MPSSITQLSEPTKLERQIREMREDIQNVEAEGLIGQLLVGWWLLGPLKFLADPALGVAETVLPPITSVVPLSDYIAGLGFGAVSNVGHLAHAVGASVGLLEDYDAEGNLVVDATEEMRRLLHERASDFHTILGFGTGITSDILQALTNREKLTEWIATLQDLRAYLMLSGIGKEVKELFRGDALWDIILLHKAQQARRQIGTDLAPSNQQLAEGYHFMKYSTASYGIASIKAARAQKRAANLHKLESPTIRRAKRALPRGSLSRRVSYSIDEPHEIATRTAICNHINMEEDRIIIFAKPGGDNHVLRHFVAVDEENRQVVLAIRGTFSVAEIVMDLNAQTRPYCGGNAHSGIADQAEMLWRTVGGIVIHTLEKNPGFELIITGHSLGAGTACLLTIKCYKEKLVGDTKVRCFAYASPPVFTPLSAAKDAVANTICYIHDDDCVPFLSVAGVRELLDSIDIVKDHREKTKRSGFIEGGQLDPELVESVTKAGSEALTDIPGAERSYIPASFVVWMRGSTREGYTASVYAPDNLPEIFVDIDMLTDHFPPFYEESLKYLCLEEK